MDLIETIASVPAGLSSPSFDPPDGHASGDPGLSFPWPGDDDAIDNYTPPAELFLVARQTGTSARGEPVFGRPQRSADDNLALSEDGYLINGEGQFVLGLPLDAEGRRLGDQPEILRIRTEPLAPAATDWVIYRANLPSFPMTANADFDRADSELLDKTQFGRDPSAHGSGIVLGDDRVKFLAQSLAGGTVTAFSRDGAKVPFVLRWAKVGSLRTAGCDWWNLFYRVRRDPRGGELAWKNCGHAFPFEADGRLKMNAQSIPVFDVTVDGCRLGNLSLIFGDGGITQFADRAGLVKVSELGANGSAGGAFAGISMSSRGRLFGHYVNDITRPVADIHFSDKENWLKDAEISAKNESARWVA